MLAFSSASASICAGDGIYLSSALHKIGKQYLPAARTAGNLLRGNVGVAATRRSGLVGADRCLRLEGRLIVPRSTGIPAPPESARRSPGRSDRHRSRCRHDRRGRAPGARRRSGRWRRASDARSCVRRAASCPPSGNSTSVRGGSWPRPGTCRTRASCGKARSAGHSCRYVCAGILADMSAGVGDVRRGVAKIAPGLRALLRRQGSGEQGENANNQRCKKCSHSGPLQ